MIRKLLATGPDLPTPSTSRAQSEHAACLPVQKPALWQQATH